jgi:hypothetical protein
MILVAKSKQPVSRQTPNAQLYTSFSFEMLTLLLPLMPMLLLLLLLLLVSRVDLAVVVLLCCMIIMRVIGWQVAMGFTQITRLVSSLV